MNRGYIELDTDVIKVRADNGYGRMVTRRRDNHSARVSSMPDGKERAHRESIIVYPSMICRLPIT